jgi:hypothetical protein
MCGRTFQSGQPSIGECAATFRSATTMLLNESCVLNVLVQGHQSGKHDKEKTERNSDTNNHWDYSFKHAHPEIILT